MGAVLRVWMVHLKNLAWKRGCVDEEGRNCGVSAEREVDTRWTLGFSRVSKVDERNRTLFRVGETAALRVRTSSMACLNGRGSARNPDSQSTVITQSPRSIALFSNLATVRS
jgi:hypothetical protein